MKIMIGAAIGAIALSASASAADKMHPLSHAHIGHVASGWTDTPKGMGLLPTAFAEAKIAAYQGRNLPETDTNTLDMEVP